MTSFEIWYSENLSVLKERFHKNYLVHNLHYLAWSFEDVGRFMDYCNTEFMRIKKDRAA